MTVNRLTDEDIKEILAQLEGTEFDGTPIVLFAKEVQKLRKENEMLRKRVEVGDAFIETAMKVRNICDISWGELESGVYTIVDDNYLAYWCRDLLDEAHEKWRESGGE